MHELLLILQIFSVEAYQSEMEENMKVIFYKTLLFSVTLHNIPKHHIHEFTTYGSVN